MLVLRLSDSALTGPCRADPGRGPAGSPDCRQPALAEPTGSLLGDAAAGPYLGDSPKPGSWLLQESAPTSQRPRSALGSNRVTDCGSRTVPKP